MPKNISIPMLTLTILATLFFTACEEQIFPENDGNPPQLVVEGYIEAGEIPLPPIVILTRSVTFAEANNVVASNNIFVHDALITVSDGASTVTLEEICWDDLDAEQKELVLENFELDEDSVNLNLCIYADFNQEMTPRIGGTYALRVEVENQILEAVTTIPPHVPIDTLFFQPRTGDGSLEFLELIVGITDAPGRLDYYRYFTSTNGRLFDAPLTSVGDDLLFDGDQFKFPLTEGETGAEPEPTPQDYGYFSRGDSITLRWLNLDEAHFRFWSTLEFNNFNQGPFGSYTLIESNIQGGLGIWGGYSNSYYELVVE